MFACVDCANPRTLRSGDKMSFQLKKIKDVGKVFTGKTPSKVVEGYFGGDIPFVTPAELDKEQFVFSSQQTLTQLGADQIKLLPKNAVMVCCIGSLGKIGIAGKELATNQQINSVVFDDKQIDFKYGFYALSRLKPLMEKIAPLTTVPIINKSNFEQLEIPVPSLSTQTQIAKILDKSTALIAKRKAQIAELDVLVQSVFLEMFGDPITNPKGWEIGKIKDVILKSQYGTSNKASETEGEYPILRMNNITYQGEMDYSNLKYIDLDEKDKEKHLVHKGELLFNRTNSKELVGKTGLYNLDKPMAFAGYLIKIIPNKEKINSQFLLAYMNSKYIKAILFNMAKNIIGMANINAKEMENISLYIPELNLQTQFAQIVEKIQTQKSQLQQSLVELEMQHQALMQRAFRGELV